MRPWLRVMTSIVLKWRCRLISLTNSRLEAQENPPLEEKEKL